MDEITRTIWVLSRPVCISVIEHLRSLLSINYQTSYQHAKISDAVLKRDEQDMKSIEEFIDERDIFGGDLRNIANGMIVNVEESLRVGEDFDKNGRFSPEILSSKNLTKPFRYQA